MANKKVSQLVAKPSVLVTDLFPIADPTTGQLYKTTISDLGTAIGSGVSSVNTLVGAVVLDTDDIQELASPTNRWFTDTRARAAVSASSPLAYNSDTGVFSIPAATSSQNGYLTSTDWTTFNNKLSPATAASTYLPLVLSTTAKSVDINGQQFTISGSTGGVFTSGRLIVDPDFSGIGYQTAGVFAGLTFTTAGAAIFSNSGIIRTLAANSLEVGYSSQQGAGFKLDINGTARFTGDVTLSSANPRLYFTDTDNNPDYFISNTDGTFTVYDVTNSTSRFTIGTTGNGTFGGNLTVGQIIRSGGTSSQFLKADGSVDSTAYVSGSGATGYYARFTGSRVISDGFIQTTSNITYVEGMGLSSLNGIDINGSYGGGGGGLKLRSYDETTGNAYIDFTNTGGRFYLGVNRSTASGLMTNATAYATVLTTGLGTTNLEFGTNATKRLTIDGTTGAATFTSTISAAGATLTGALSGTSASFSSTINSNDGTRNIFINPAADFGNGALPSIQVASNHGLQFATNNTLRLTIASTGAATFSSSVTATNIALNGTANASTVLTLQESTTFPSALVMVNRNSTQKWNISVDASSVDDKYLGFIDTTNSAVRMVLGANGNVGIGTTAPSQKLDVVGQITYGDGTNYGRIGGISGESFLSSDTGGNNLTFYTKPSGGSLTERFRVMSTGNIRYFITPAVDTNLEWFNTSNSTVVAKIWANGAPQLIAQVGGSGGVYLASGGVAWLALSDEKLKTDLQPIEDAINKVSSLRSMIGRYKTDNENIRRPFLIAQDVLEVLPEAVNKDEKTGNLGVSYSEVIPLLVASIKELKAELDTLKNK